jgi:predicted RNA-binding protein associated with RNAse of E/G family
MRAESLFALEFRGCVLEQSFFTRGARIVLREIWQGRVWSAKPVIVVQDTPEMLALYLPVGTPYKQPRTLDGKEVTPKTRVEGKWLLVDNVWPDDGECLRLVISGVPYSVLCFWLEAHSKFRDWYINLEDPLRRTSIGFDYMDQLLDIIVQPDLSSWFWKDEDEFQEAQESGLISPERAREMRADGEKVVEMLLSGKSIFNGWEHWKPDPAWEMPTLPEEWERV